MRFGEGLGKKIIGGVLAGVLSYAPVRAAEIVTVPEKTRWVADGVTRYKLNVWVDNTGLGGEPTDGVQWRLMQNFNYVVGSNQIPTSNDFFSGVSMLWNNIRSPNFVSSRLVAQVGGGPVNRTGNVGEYKFTVPTEWATGIYAFDLWDTKLVNPSNINQPHTVRSAPINVSGRGDLNCDGVHNGEDIGAFVEALVNPTMYGLRYPQCSVILADMNGDRIVNEADIPLFVNALL